MKDIQLVSFLASSHVICHFIYALHHEVYSKTVHFGTIFEYIWYFIPGTIINIPYHPQTVDINQGDLERVPRV